MTAHRFSTVLNQQYVSLELVSNQRGHCVGKYCLQSTRLRAVQAFHYRRGLKFFDVIISEVICNL